MPRTPDRQPGESLEEGILFEATALATQAGEVRYNGTRFSFRDATGEFDPRTGGSGITEANFFLDADPPTAPNNTYDITRSGGQVTQERWRRTSDSSNLKTIDYTYVGGRVSTEVRKVYASDGTTVLAQITVTYSYSGGTVTGATVVRDV